MALTKLLRLLMVLLVCVIFVSFPALSGEHPWDSDDGGGGVTNDSTGIGDGGDDYEVGVRVDRDADGGNTSLSTSFRLSYWLYSFFTEKFGYDSWFGPTKTQTNRNGSNRYSDK